MLFLGCLLEGDVLVNRCTRSVCCIGFRDVVLLCLDSSGTLGSRQDGQTTLETKRCGNALMSVTSLLVGIMVEFTDSEGPVT